MMVRQSRASFVGEILGIADAHDLGRGVAPETSGRKGDRRPPRISVGAAFRGFSSQLTQRWSKEDSNSPSHPERQRSEDRRKQVRSRDGMMFLAGWLLRSIRLAAALGLALVAMQAPAATREYKAALWFGGTLANLLGCCRDL
jgi:hypothetical protein